MTDVATNLSTINSSLSDIKTAIVNKGVTPSGNITTYATAIGSIPSGGTSLTGLKVNVTFENGASWDNIEYIEISMAQGMPGAQIQGVAGFLPIILTGPIRENDTVYYQVKSRDEVNVLPDIFGSITLQGSYAELNFVVSLS